MKSTYPYRVLSIVAETGKIITAAEILHLTPSAVSHTILTLEKNLGFAIFRRNRNGVELTDNGARILPLVRSIIREQENLEQRASSILGIHEGTVRVGAFYSVTMNWLVDIFTKFHTLYPNIEIQFYEGGHQDILRWIELNMVDLVFIGDYAAVGHKFIPLYMDELKCVTPMDFIPPESGALSAADLEEQSLIIQEEGEDGDTQRILQRLSKTPKKPHFVIEDDNCIMAMVEAGLGIAFMGNLACNRPISNVQTFSLAPKAYRTIGLHIPNMKSISPATEKMRNCIIQYVSELKNSPTSEGIVLC
ncbi:MAG: LysR family transcriptional regulator [Bacillota bacterium]|nr:LysR family transcriptional regulator [Bacillota bacterium]